MKTVLFVCVHNSGRSQMAEAFFNHLAEGRAIAYSAGTDPAGSINPDVLKVMQESGIDISGQVPKALTSEMLEQADKVVTMGCGVEGVCPASFIPTEDWELDDPEGQSIEKIREIRDDIRTFIKKLLDDMRSPEERWNT